MATISVPSSLQGKTYSVKIAGDTPTPEEQARISAFVAQQDAQLSKFLSGYTPPTPEDTGPDTSYSGALLSGIDQPLENIATTARMLGGNGIADFLSGATEAPKNYESATTGFMNEDGNFYDFSYLPRAAVEQVGQFGGSMLSRLGGAALGGVAGSAIPGVGNIAGAAAGAFAGPALFEAIQIVGPVAQQRAKNDGRETPNSEDWLAALGTAGVSGALNAIAPGTPGFLKKVLAEAGTEGLQSLTEQIGGSAGTKAGLQIDPRQAGAEAILGGAGAGIVDAPFAAVGAKSEAKKKAADAEAKALSEMQEDQEEDAKDIMAKIGFGQKSMEAPVEKPKRLTTNLLPSPTAGQQTAPEGRPVATVTPPVVTTQPTAEAPLPGQPARPAPSFRWKQYQSTIQNIGKAKAPTIAAIQKAAETAGNGPVTPSVARDIRSQMERDGVVKPSAKVKGGYEYQPNVTPQVDRAESYRRTIEDVTREAQDARLAREKALQDARRAQQTGKLPDYRKFMLQVDKADQDIAAAERTVQEVSAQMPMAQQQEAVPTAQQPRSLMEGKQKFAPITEAGPAAQARAVTSRGQRLRQAMSYYQDQARRQNLELRRLQDAQKKVQLPKSDIKRMDDLKAYIADATRNVQQIGQRLANPTADIEENVAQQKAAEAKQAAAQAERAAKTPIYGQKEGEIFNALRKRLNGMGLKDVQLVAEKMLKPETANQGALYEGLFDVKDGNRLIAVSMGVYDPNMTAKEQTDALGEVVDHEVIHALKNLGLFTDAEWKTLTDLAARQQYMKAKGGKVVQRNYTYLQRAKQMYASETPEIQVEEAIAEMFRDYVAGRLKIGGRPKTLMDRIKAFFASIRKSHEDAGITDPNQIFEGVRFGQIGGRERKTENRVSPVSPNEAATERASKLEAVMRDKPMLTVPEGTRAHKLPDVLLTSGNGQEPSFPITQKYAPANIQRNNVAITDAISSNEGALASEYGWGKLMQETFGGEYLPKAPFVAIDYARSPEAVAEKLKRLTPALKDGVDRGFKHVTALRDMYRTGQATPDMTADLFIWGILSRGAGPVQQEGAYIDVIDAAKPFVDKAISGPLSDADLDMWKTKVTGALREGSPGRQVTMNVNAAGTLLQAMSQYAPNSDKTVLQEVHDMMSDPEISGPEIRRWFLSNTESAGIDNKVVSFILLVGGRDDVLVMDRIQSRHLWDDGRFGGMNIYDGLENGGGLSQIMKGPRGLLVTEALENGLKDSVMEAYNIIGRPGDASLGRFHWESWVIEGEQVVDHSTLAAVSSRTPVGFSVTEGKMATFSSGSRYIRTDKGSVIEYPLSNGGHVYMKPTTFKDFLDSIKSGKVLDADGKSVKLDNPVLPKGFKVTERADIPWYQRPDVDRAALDSLAKRYEDAKSEGQVYGRDARSGERPSPDGSGQSRYSRIGAGGQAGDGRGREEVRGLAPLEGAPQVRGASGPDMRLVRVAEDYARSIGIDLRRQAYYAKVDPDRATRIAEAYEAMPHAPNDPKVKEAYQNLIDQTTAQYRALEDAGYKFWFMDPENVGEYGSSPWNAMRDLRANQSMGVYPTTGGFGTNEEADISGNPMLAETGIMWPFGSPDGTKVPVLANDLFRAVHDAFGHGLEGAGFRADGEENAWQAHIRLFTGSAKGAITSETRGQNSWLNYGPYGEANRNAKVEDTVFADQKTGIMPEWTWEEGRVPDAEAYPEARASVRYSVTPYTKAVQQKVQSNQNALMYAKSSDLIAKLLNLRGYGMEEQKAREFSDGILRRFQDSMIPIGRMVQELTQAGLTITDAMDPYLQESLMHGVVGQKVEENQKTLFKPLLDAVKGLNVPKARIDALVAASDAASAKGKGFVGLALQRYNSPRLALADALLYARHAKERNRFVEGNRDITNQSGSGMTDAEADAILNWVRGLDDVNRGLLAKIDQQARMIVENTNRTRVDAGLISPEVAGLDGETVEGANFKYYVPLRGKFGEDADDKFTGPPSNPLFGAKGREDKQMLGRFDYGTDLIANLFTQNQNAILRGERNKVGQSFLKLLRADPEMTSSYASILERVPMRRVPGKGGKLKDVPDQLAAQEPDILIVKENGKQTWVRFTDPGMAGAMNGRNGMSPSSANVMLRAMQTLNRYLSTINTSYNPEFIITNGFRDLQTGLLNMNQFELDGVVKEVMGGLKGAALGIRSVIRKDNDTSEWAKVYKDYMAAGGQNVTNQFNTLSEELGNIQSMLGDISEAGISGKWAKVKDSFVGKRVGSVIRTIEDYNTIVENTIRLSAYKALLDRGFTRQRAAQAARNLTVNFAKGGDYRQFMGAWSLFYNASLQGSFALLNAAVRSPRVRKMWLGLIIAGIAQDQLNAMFSDDDDDGEKVYDKIPDYILERNFVLPDFLNLTDRSYITIPMPYGLNMAHNLGRAASAAWRGAKDPGDAAHQIMMNVLDTVNPLGGTESFYNFAAPTIVDPLVDIVENKDFADKPIYKEGLPFDKTPAPNSQQYWSTTSPSAVWISNMLNEMTGGNEVRPGFIDWSPDVLEFWFDFATGGIGRFAQSSVEGPLAVMGEGLTEDTIRQVPLARKLVGSVSSREDTGAYMEGAKRVLMAAEELKRARETGDADWARETIQTYGKELRLIGPIKSIETSLRKISMQRNQITDNPNIPEDQKRLLLDRLDARKQMILSQGNKMLKSLE